MSATHTPGPWRLTASPYEDGTPYFKIEAGEGFFGDLEAPSGFNVDGIVSEADARLMAAAPELLAALKRMEEADRKQVAGETYDYSNAVLEARAAIAKATGRPT